MVFALVEDTIVTAIDHKPKRTRRLARLRNVEMHPRVGILVHHYEDDWRRLWWVRADGAGHTVDRLSSDHRAALVDKYDQYRSRPPAGPGLLIAVDSVTGWEFEAD